MEGKVYTVSGLTAEIKGTLEARFPEVWVKGEVSNARRQSSGHWYFTLKDDGAQVSGVLFRGEAARSTVTLRNGMEVTGFGRVNVFEPRGVYQVVFRTVMDSGLGRLQQAFEALKRKLADEGLFDPSRKRPLPPLPSTIGFVTSPTGAAVRDFVSILRRRDWRGQLIVLPVRVQGREAAPEIARMVRWAGGAGLFDLLVVGRGGGSLEDLWPFNEEEVVRAVAECSLPTISAVGHEIDYALTDFAADARAETPSAAAELVSSAFVALAERVQVLADDFEAALENRLERMRQRLELAGSRLRRHSPELRLENAWLRLDDARARLRQTLAEGVRIRREHFAEAVVGLRAVSPEFALRMRRERLTQLGHRLENLGVERILRRGFAILWDEEGNPVTSKAAAETHARLSAQLRDGRVKLDVVRRKKQREFEF